jgi:4-hydroxyacetophenone monooxygenase
MPTVDRAYIRRALEMADLNAVRMALLHDTRDPSIAALPVAADLDDAGREYLISKAVDWLQKNAGRGLPAVPSDAELRALMNLATHEEMGDLEFEARRELPAFRPFPYVAAWTRGKPAIPEDFKVAIIGSGFSGITMGVQLAQLGVPYVVLERRDEPGGTWSINRYPDIRVDTISINYEFPFEKLHPWSEYFASGAEVRKYLEYISKKYRIHEETRFNHDLQRATFDERRHRWILEVATPKGTEIIEANVVVSATGLFANPKIPTFEGQETYEGRIVHSARWPKDLDLEGKRVAILGNGSTGVQMLSAIAEDAEQVFVFQRTPQWIAPVPHYGQKLEPEVAWLVANFPGYWNWWHYAASMPLFETHDLLLPDPEWQAKGGKVNRKNDELREMLTRYMKVETGGRKDLLDRLMPDYAPWSRRPIVDNGWYRALTRSNVELVTDGIARLVPQGIQTVDGTIRAVDVIVTATGFDVAKFLWPSKYIGRNRTDLHETWDKGEGPRAYLGMMLPDFPNLFMMYGPNSQPVSGGTNLPIWYSVWAAYVGRCLVRLLETDKSCIEVRSDAYRRYNAALDEEGRRLLQLRPEGGVGRNYYVNQEHQRLQVQAPWYGPEYHRMCTQVDWSDLEISGPDRAILHAANRDPDRYG